MNHPIVLLTDFGLEDLYVGQLKGMVLKNYAKAEIIDLGHFVEPFNIRQAAFILENSIRYFPKGSIFVCVIDPGVGTKRKIVCLKTEGSYFIGPDNGLFSFLLKQENPIQIKLLNSVPSSAGMKISNTFHGRDIMAPFAGKLSKNIRLFSAQQTFTKPLVTLPAQKIENSKKSIVGEIIYFDRFGNAITNLRKDSKSDEFWNSASIQVANKPLTKLITTYSMAHQAQAAALFNSIGYLELLIKNKSIQKSQHLKIGMRVSVNRGRVK